MNDKTGYLYFNCPKDYAIPLKDNRGLPFSASIGLSMELPESCKDKKSQDKFISDFINNSKDKIRRNKIISNLRKVGYEYKKK